MAQGEDNKQKIERLEREKEQLRKWLDDERQKLAEARRRNYALLKEHKRILDLTFSAD